METTITLPKSGATVVLRDPSELRQKDREKVFAMISAEDTPLIQTLNITKGLIMLLVKSWTLDLIIPSVHIQSIGELEMADYDALAIEANKAQDILFPNFTTGDNPDSPKDNLNA